MAPQPDSSIAIVDRLSVLLDELAAHFGAADSAVDGRTALLSRTDATAQESRPTAQWRDALIELMQALPALVDRLQRLDELEHDFAGALEKAKLDALKEFAYGASHEINNPLANISARAQTLLQEERDPERRRRLAAINSQAFRAHEMIADLMLFARPPRMARADTDLASLVRAIVATLSDSAAAQNTQLAVSSIGESLVARVDPVQMRVALRALLTNALEALGEGGRIETTVRAASAGERRAAGFEIIVADTGPGIAAEIRPHIFEPFYCGREAGRGLGLGLSKCWRIVTEHGGRIDVESPLAGGATFTIRLPARIRRF